ncbi:Uncharacterised protein [Actinobacillus equuli]|nr:Uncharacterised protein [Actinobacillus equuli]
MEGIHVDLYKEIFANKRKVTVKFQPKLRIFTAPLDKTSVYVFDDLATLFDYVFDESNLSILHFILRIN